MEAVIYEVLIVAACVSLFSLIRLGSSAAAVLDIVVDDKIQLIFSEPIVACQGSVDLVDDLLRQ
jgi:hypothetical protein